MVEWSPVDWDSVMYGEDCGIDTDIMHYASHKLSSVQILVTQQTDYNQIWNRKKSLVWKILNRNMY